MNSNSRRRIVSDIGRMAKKEASRAGNRSAAIPPTQQLQEYMSGEHRWRLESGELTPKQWQRYEQRMQKELRRRLGDGTL